MKPWKLDEGLKLVRALQSRVTEFGYHITLGGGVLNNGASESDLDLYFLPLIRSEPTDHRGLVTWLSVLWGPPKNDRDDSDRVIRRVGTRNDVIRPSTPQWIPAASPTRFIREDEPVDPEDSPTVLTVYKHQLKFERAGSDRIDVFIV